jgi:magnesium-transporting ATPase (P-type)
MLVEEPWHSKQALTQFVSGSRIAQATLKALQSRLAWNASVLRDGKWKTTPPAELVCGDLIKLSLGVVVVTDAHMVGGAGLLDQ